MLLELDKFELLSLIISVANRLADDAFSSDEEYPGKTHLLDLAIRLHELVNALPEDREETTF